MKQRQSYSTLHQTAQLFGAAIITIITTTTTL